jgi:hypothetical protein
MNNKQETIERYLRQEMGEEELKNFTFQMVMNPSLRKEIEDTRKIFKTLRTQQPPVVKSTTNWFAIGISALVIIGCLYFLFSKNNTEITPDKNQDIQQKITPIAATDLFLPNTYFEDLTTRQMDFQLNIENETAQEFAIDINEVFDFQLKCNLTGNRVPKQLLLTLWSNKMEDFENDESIFSEIVQVSSENRIDFQKDLNLGEGLFYYIFTLPQTDEPISSGKFTIRQR